MPFSLIHSFVGSVKAPMRNLRAKIKRCFKSDKDFLQDLLAMPQTQVHVYRSPVYVPGKDNIFLEPSCTPPGSSNELLLSENPWKYCISEGYKLPMKWNFDLESCPGSPVEGEEPQIMSKVGLLGASLFDDLGISDEYAHGQTRGLRKSTSWSGPINEFKLEKRVENTKNPKLAKTLSIARSQAVQILKPLNSIFVKTPKKVVHQIPSYTLETRPATSHGAFPEYNDPSRVSSSTKSGARSWSFETFATSVGLDSLKESARARLQKARSKVSSKIKQGFPKRQIANDACPDIEQDTGDKVGSKRLRFKKTMKKVFRTKTKNEASL